MPNQRLHGQFPQLFTIGRPLHTSRIDPRLVCAISGFSAHRQLWRSHREGGRSATSRAMAGDHGALSGLLDVSGRRHGSALLEHASTYRAQLKPSAISANRSSCCSWGLAGIPLGP